MRASSSIVLATLRRKEVLGTPTQILCHPAALSRVLLQRLFGSLERAAARGGHNALQDQVTREPWPT